MNDIRLFDNNDESFYTYNSKKRNNVKKNKQKKIDSYEKCDLLNA